MTEFNLSNIAAHLEGLEETIISKLIDRAQFCLNSVVYDKGKSGFERETKRSLFEIRLLFQERMDSQFGRFCVPEERPFYCKLPATRRDVSLPDTGLKITNFDTINLTKDILPAYLSLLPSICKEGTDGHFGSSVEHDIYAIQAIARRIHYGSLYVAESKFRSSPQEYQDAADAHDTDRLMAMLTRKEVEDKIVERLREKVNTTQVSVNRDVRHTIDPEIIMTFYRESIIPLTKKGEIQYFLERPTE